MYTIIGGDQQEYGPASLEQIRQWIQEGRANGQTLARTDEDPQWLPLSAYPEFNDLVEPPPAPEPTPAPAPEPVDPESLRDHVLNRDYNVDIGGCFTRSLQLFQQWFLPLIGATALILLLVISANYLIGLAVPIPAITELFDEILEGGLSGLSIGKIFLNVLLVNLVQPILFGGLYLFILRLIRGQQAEVEAALSGFTICPGQLAAAGAVTTVLAMIGFMLFLLPGIYLTIAWTFAVPLIIDKGFGFWQAMEVSRRVVTRHWWILLCLVIVVELFKLAGVLVCFVGILVTTPIGMGALMYAYEDIFRIQTPTAP